MSLSENHDSVSDDSHHDGGNAIEHVGDEANDIAKAVAPEFREINAGAHANGNTQNAGQGEDQPRAHDGVGHSSARFTHGLWNLRKEGPVERADTTVNKISEYGEQG